MNKSHSNNCDIETQNFMFRLSEKVVNFEMNNYTMENILFGKLQPNEKIPFDKFVKELDIGFYKPYLHRDSISGIAISKDENVINCDFFTCAKMLYNFYMNKIIGAALYQMPLCDDYELFVFQYNLKTYAEDLFPIFMQILNTEIRTSNLFLKNAIPFSEQYYAKLARFVIAIRTKKLRPLKRVDKYLIDLPFIPFYINRLLILKKKTCGFSEYKY